MENYHFGDKQLIFQGPGISTKITKPWLSAKRQMEKKMSYQKKIGGEKKHLAKLWMTPTPTLLFWANKSDDSEFDKSSGAAWELKGEARIFARLFWAFTCNSITSPLRNWMKLVYSYFHVWEITLGLTTSPQLIAEANRIPDLLCPNQLLQTGWNWRHSWWLSNPNWITCGDYQYLLETKIKFLAIAH